MAALPIEPDARLVPFAPTAERALEVFGAPATLVLVPGRSARPGRAGPERPPLQRCRAGRIVADESIWRDDGLAATPNLYAFGREQRILWMAEPVREPDAAFWRTAIDWAHRAGGSALLNTIGAAATIPRAHAHLIAERLPFLAALPERPLRDAPIDVPRGCELIAKDVPFCLVGVRGPCEAVARALVLLAEARMTPSWNVAVQDDTAWILPRTVETPTPHFPQPLGAAELWGRWCYVDQQAFERAASRGLEQALLTAAAPALD